MLFDALIWGISAPALAALALTLGAGREAGGWRNRLATLAPAAAIWVAYLGLVGWPAIPPREAMQLLPWFLLLPLVGARPWFLALAAAALPAALAWNLWTRDAQGTLLALAPVFLAGPPLVYVQARATAGGGLRPAWYLVWTIGAAVSAGIFVLAHSAKLAQLSGAAAAAAGALMALHLVLRRRGAEAGLTPPLGASCPEAVGDRRGPAWAWSDAPGAPAILALSHLGLVSLARLFAYPELPFWPETLGLLLWPTMAVWIATRSK